MKTRLTQNKAVNLRYMFNLFKTYNIQSQGLKNRSWAFVKISSDAAAKGDPISDGKLANLDPWISSKSLVELQYEIPVIPNILP